MKWWWNMVQTRNVVSQDDAFLYELYISTRKNEFSMLALDEQQLHALLLIQYEAQKRFYQQNFPQAKHEIIFHEGLEIGRMMTECKSGNIHLIDISLLPDFRGKGYGTKLLKQLQNSAASQNLSVTLHVWHGNPARRLYERCGFYVTEDISPYIAMRFESLG
ncbi:N-acetyltransferase [Lysinibacillus sphaericus]|nr:N-acetyltransferase [Lysinibacillus sphaericus]QPA60978.1 GNAT family N-acetyltransferase [Lysinibacillus sphaericus]